LQAHRHRDGEVVHHRPEARAFLVHVDEDLAQRAVLVFAGAQVDLVPADDGLLGVALAALRHLLAVARTISLTTTFSTIFSASTCAFSCGCRFRALGGLLVILDQRAASGWLSLEPSR
jgi:hypothetical protein